MTCDVLMGSLNPTHSVTHSVLECTEILVGTEREFHMLGASLLMVFAADAGSFSGTVSTLSLMIAKSVMVSR